MRGTVDSFAGGSQSETRLDKSNNDVFHFVICFILKLIPFLLSKFRGNLLCITCQAPFKSVVMYGVRDCSE